MIKPLFGALALALGLSNSATAASFTVDWQLVSVCETDIRCATLDYDATELQRIFDQADIEINILPTITVTDPLSYDAFNPVSPVSPTDVLRDRRPGVANTINTGPLVTWILGPVVPTAFRQVALLNVSGALVDPPQPGGANAARTDFASLTLARGISQNLGLEPLFGADCLPDNLQNSPSFVSPEPECRPGTSFSDLQIERMQSSRFVTRLPDPMPQVPLPAGGLLLASGLGLLAWRCRRT